MMAGFLDRFFGTQRTTGSKDDAKSRLKVVLMHDQVDLTPAQMEAMKTELLAVIARYADIDRDHMELRLERVDNRISVVSSVPVRRITGRMATAH